MNILGPDGQPMSLVPPQLEPDMAWLMTMKRGSKWVVCGQWFELTDIMPPHPDAPQGGILMQPRGPTGKTKKGKS